jgi:hypothetical protein
VHQETGGGSKSRGPRQSRSVSPQDEDGHLTLKTEDQPLDLHSTQYVKLLCGNVRLIEHAAAVVHHMSGKTMWPQFYVTGVVNQISQPS